jgi:hypothetical protein
MISEQIHNCKFHLYVDSFQPYTVDLGRDVDTLVRFVNEDLERSCFWSAVNFLVLYMSKTQAMLISRRDRGAVLEHSLTVAGDVVVFSESERMSFDNRLSWREQVSRVVSRTYPTLQLLYRFQRYTCAFSYAHGVGFLEFRRFELAFNACMKYVFGLRRFDHISGFPNVEGYAFFEYLELRFACFIHKIGLVGKISCFNTRITVTI